MRRILPWFSSRSTLSSWVGFRLALAAGLISPQVVAQGSSAVEQPSDEQAPSGPVIERPQLYRYEPPVYPPDAYERGLEAKVRLAITVEEDGTVSDPEVLEPVGHGFDEAAVAAARGLIFIPAKVDGESRKVRIGFEYVFEIQEQADDDSSGANLAEAEAQPQVGELRGRLLVSGAESPLPGVEVVLTDALGSEYRTRTDEEGGWVFEGMPAGTFEVAIRADGFETVESQERVYAGEATEITYRVVPETDQLVVEVRGERPPREVTRRTLERREIARIPGTSGDALRSIQSLPGVARPPGLAGLLIVRGSAPADTETFIDGTNVPLIYHFGGLSSVVPTEMLDKIDFYPGNFSVKYGRLRGGVVDVDLRSPNTDCYGDGGEVTGETGCFHGLAQVDLIDGRVMFEGPIADDWSFAVAGRRSWIDSWLKPVLESAGSSVTSAPVYYDYQVLVDRDRGPGDNLSFRFYGSDDRFETIITNPAAQNPGFGGTLRFGTSFSRGQVVYRKDLTEKATLNAMFSAGHQTIDFGVGGNFIFELNSVPINLRSEIGYQIHPTARVNVGMDLLTGPFEVFVRAPPPTQPGEASPGPFATRQPLENRVQGFSWRPGWYMDVEWQPTDRLRVVPGVRFDYALDTQSPDFSPRMNLRYELFQPQDEAFFGKARKTVLKAGVGKFSQPPAFQETDEVFGTPGLRSNDSIHYSVGVEQGLTKQVEISLEGFYKDFYNSVAQTPTLSGGFGYNNQGLGQVVGLETLLRYNADARFFGWVAYTLSESLRQNCATCEVRPFQFDQTHNLIMVGSYRLGRGWEFGARFRIVSGPLETPVNSDPLPALFAGDAGTYEAIPGTPFSQRLPLFHQLDMRVDKRWQFRNWRLSTYLDVQNVYNNMAVEGLVYNFDFSQQAFQTGLPILPSIGVRGEF